MTHGPSGATARSGVARRWLRAGSGRHAPATRPTRSPCATSGATSRSRPSPTDVRHAGRHGDRADDPRADLAAPIPTTASWARSTGRRRRRAGPLVHRPDRRDPQLHPRRAAVRDAARRRGGRRAPGRGDLRAGAGGALVRAGAAAAPGRSARRAGDGRRGSGSRRSRRSRTRSSCTARARDIAVGAGAGFESLLDDVWRERGFGDFWGYALVAEGAAEGMVEVELSTWDAAAPRDRRRGGGGRWSDLDGERRIDTGPSWSPTASCTRSSSRGCEPTGLTLAG